VQKAYELRLNLQNLTDRHYYEAASAGRATAVDGRRLIVSGTWRFL
jgi:outer membrane receptor protein involved in Fe transport